MKKTILFHILIFSSIIITAQTQHITDSLYQKLHQEVNIVNPSSGRSDVVWERIPLPEGKILQTFKVMPDNNVYIGCRNGGVYKYKGGDWELVGLPDISVYDFEEYINGELLAGTDEVFLWDYNDWYLISDMMLPFITNTFDYFFGCGSFADLYRSTDGCHTWDLVFDLSFEEAINGLVATTPDSVFLGIADYSGNQGGVYLSVDSGSTWNHFGLSQHYIGALAIDNYNQVYAGNNGHHITFQGGLYKYCYSNNIWDSILYFPYVRSIVFNSENHIYLGFDVSGSSNQGGVMHSEDNGLSWILDTTGMGNRMVNELQIDNNGYLYALTGYEIKRIYRSVLPVSINEPNSDKSNDFVFYPNPARDNINIKIDNGLSQQNVSIKVFNIYGDCIINNETNYIEKDNNITLNVSNLELGIYICQIQKNNIKSNFKFIKQ